MTTKQLKDTNIERQTGVLQEEIPPVKANRLNTGATAQDLEQAKMFGRILEARKSVMNPYRGIPGYEPLAAQVDNWQEENRDTIQEAIDDTEKGLAVGYGTRRIDRSIGLMDDMTDARAAAQSEATKVLTGAAKLGTTMLTQFAEGTAGTVMSLLNIPIEGVKSAVNGTQFSPGAAMANNPVTKFLNEEVTPFWENVFPNYYSHEEQSKEWQDEWWKHLNGNFWGDGLLKNIGFTLGSIGAAYVGTGVYNKWAMGKMANNLFKGAVAGAAGDKAAYEAFQAFRGGAINIEQLAKNSSYAAKQVRKLQRSQQLLGALGGAASEARVEAIGAAQEFMKDKSTYLNDAYQLGLQEIEKDMQKEDAQHNSGWYEEVPLYDDYGNVVGSTTELSAAGEAEYEKRRQNVADKFDRSRQFLEQQANNVAAATFWMNIPILTASNIIQFGRMFAGGFKATRALMSPVKGGITYDKAAGRFIGQYAGKGSKFGAVLHGVMNPVSEGLEELSQKIVSEGAKKTGARNITAFNDDAYDEYGAKGALAWIGGALDNIMPTVTDATTWKEFAIGALTGLIPLGEGAGVSGGYREAVQKMKDSADMAAALNKLVESDEFQNRWKWATRAIKYEKEYSDGAENGNRYIAKSAESKAMTNDIIAFAEAGRLQDLGDIVDSYAKITTSDTKDLEDIRDYVKTREGVRVFENSSDEEMVAAIHRRASEMKRHIQDVKEASENIRARGPVHIDKDKLQEMTFTAAQLRDAEYRYNELVQETLYGKKDEKGVRKGGLHDILEKWAQHDESGKFQDREQRAKSLLEKEDTLRTLFAAGINKWWNFASTSREDMLKANKMLDDFKKLAEETGDTDSLTKISDIQKLVSDRADYWEKLQMLQDMEDDTWKEKAMSRDKKVKQEEEKMQAEQDKKDQDEIDELGKYGDIVQLKEAYKAKRGHERNKFRENLRKAAERGNTAAKTFIEWYDKGTRLKDAVKRMTAYKDKSSLDTATRYDIKAVVDEVIKNARSWNDVKEKLNTLTQSEFENCINNSHVIDSPENLRPIAERFKLVEKGVKDLLDSFIEDDDLRPDRPTVEKHEDPETKKPIERKGGIDPSNPSPAQTPPPPKPPKKADTKKESEDKKKEETKPQEKESAAPQIPVEKFTSQEELMRKEQEDVKRASEERKAADLLSKADAAKASIVPEKASSSEDAEDAHPYYFPIIPEFGVKSREEGTFIPLNKEDPAFDIIYSNFLRENAFEYVDKGGLEIGSEIEFGIDPNFTDNTDELPILMFHTDKNGVRHVVGSLRKEGKENYVGLTALDKKIRSEYEAFAKNHPDETYIFGKKSRVWMIKDGNIPYLESSDTGENDRSIADVGMGFDSKAPYVLCAGNRVTGIGISVSSSEATMYRPSSKGGAALYYVATSARGNKVPIRVNVAHYNAEEAGDNDAAIIEHINSLLRRIADVSNWDDDILQELKMGTKGLEKFLYVNDIHIYANTNSTTGARMLSIRADVRDEQGNPIYEKVEEQGAEGEVRTSQVKVQKDILVIDEFSEDIEERIRNAFYELNRPLQVTPATSHATLVDMATHGLLTANVSAVYTRGAFFYVDPFNESTGDFSDIRKSLGESVFPAQPTAQTNAVYQAGRGTTSIEGGEVKFYEDVANALGTNIDGTNDEAQILSNLTQKSAGAKAQYVKYVNSLAEYYGVDLSDLVDDQSVENRKEIARRCMQQGRSATMRAVDAVTYQLSHACATQEEKVKMEQGLSPAAYAQEYMGDSTPLRAQIEASLKMKSGATSVRFTSAGTVLKGKDKAGVIPITAVLTFKDGSTKTALVVPAPHDQGKGTSTVTKWLSTNPKRKEGKRFYKEPFIQWYAKYATALDNLNAINGNGLSDLLYLLPTSYTKDSDNNITITDIEDAVHVARVDQSVLPLSAEEVAMYATGEVAMEETESAASNEASSEGTSDSSKRYHDTAAFMEVGTDLRGYERGIDLKAEMDWLDKVLPQLGKNDRLRIVNGLIRTAKNEAGAYGKMQNAMIYLSNEGVEGTAYHEAFHYVMDNMLSPTERLSLLKEASRVYKTKDIKILSEEMADDFREWMLTGTVRRNSSLSKYESKGLWNKIKDFFTYLGNIISNITRLQPHMHRLFKQIANSEYAVGEPIDNGSFYNTEVEQGIYDEATKESIASLNDNHFPAEKKENATSVWDIKTTFKQEHIDAAIEALNKAVKEGFYFDFGGKTSNITYDTKTGFQFHNLSHDKSLYGKGTKGAVARFMEIIGSTGMNYKYLDSEVQGYLMEEGWEEQEYDALSYLMKKQALICAGVM